MTTRTILIIAAVFVGYQVLVKPALGGCGCK